MKILSGIYWNVILLTLELVLKSNCITTSRNSTRINDRRGLLPSLAADNSEFALGAIIERVPDSFDLFATIFLLRHKMLNSKTTVYSQNGHRIRSEKIYCKMSHTEDGPYYTAEGEFVTSDLAPEYEGDVHLEILRCKMEDTERAYMSLARSSEELHIELFRGRFPLLQFRIPWRIRRTGYMLSEQDEGTANSRFDAWKGFDNEFPGLWAPDRMHLCVAGGWDVFPTRRTLPSLLEFLQHHILLKIDHIFTAASFKWSSPQMSLLINVLGSFIDDKLVSLTTYADNDLNELRRIGGLGWTAEQRALFEESLHVQMCSYYSRGAADFVGIWRVTDFFILGRGVKSLPILLSSLMQKGAVTTVYTELKVTSNVLVTYSQHDEIPKLDSRRAGPPSHLLLASMESRMDTTAKINKHESNTGLTEIPPPGVWVGQRVNMPNSHHVRSKRTVLIRGFQNSILYAGSSWKKPSWMEGTLVSEITPTNSSLKTAGVKQTAGMLLLRAGFLNHISLKHQQNSPFKVQLPLQKYQYHYFPMVYEALERRGLVGPMELPETVDKQNNFSLHGDMDDYFEFLLRVQRLVNEGPTSNGMIDAPHKNVTLFSSIPSIDVMSPPSPISNQNASGTEDVRFSESSAEYSSLPSIIPDRSDLFLASMVEREADSWNLHLTTFLLDHRMLRKDKSNYGVRKIQHDVETYSLWAKAIVAFRRQKYQSSGARALNPRYFCRITTSSSDQPYVVQGEFMPTDTITYPSHSNRRAEVFRCKMRDGEQLYSRLARSEEEITVEIFREVESLIKFSVPWASRVTGTFLSVPKQHTPARGKMGTSKNPLPTTLDPWKGYDKMHPGEWKRDRLYLCVPGVDSVPNQESIPTFLEFLQHHLLLGVAHIFVTMPFTWDGAIHTYMRLLRSFIEEGSLSLNTHIHHDKDYLYALFGLEFERDNMKTLQATFCNYYSKGMTDYLGIWDTDEFFIPKGKNKSLLDVVNSASFPPNETVDRVIRKGLDKMEWNGGRGWADKDGHPFCYLKLQSEVLIVSDADSRSKSWMGDKVPHSSEPLHTGKAIGYGNVKSIVPTHTAFQVGLHGAGACVMDTPVGCPSSNPFCHTNGREIQAADYFHRTHYLDEWVFMTDAKLVSLATEGCLYHYQIHRPHFAPSDETDLTTQNIYTAHYFKSVIAALKKRRLDLLVDIPYRTF